jgi:type I restriction enzyme M protein
LAEWENDGEPFEENMSRLIGELADLFAQSHELEDEIKKRLGAMG